MFNRDIVGNAMQSYSEALMSALQNNDAKEAAKAMQDAQNAICEAIEAEFEQYQGIGDMEVLQQRGLRKLTSEETAWYQKFISAVKTGAKQEIANIGSAMPITIVDRVIADMQKAHPLLNEIDIQNAAGSRKLIMNGIQMASKLGAWGVIGSGITEEIAGQIKVADVTVAKYTAYFLIPKDFVKFNFTFAPMWVDQYIRIVLSESVAFGLEKSMIGGDGVNQFIGMIMDTSTNSNGRYTAKSPVALADFDDAYADVIAGLAKDGNGDDRDFDEVLLIVNPQDYIKKIRRIQNTLVPGAGIVDMISNTFPTRVVKSSMVAAGKAVVGIAKNYFAGINGGASGIIEYDDSAQFLNDIRVYTTRIYGHGQPIDNTSFAYLDISAVEVPAFPVKVKGTVKTKEQA